MLPRREAIAASGMAIEAQRAVFGCPDEVVATTSILNMLLVAHA